jgi:hypothetical protein
MPDMDMGKRRKRGAPVSQSKARMMMHEGAIKGHPMTEKQRGMFGAIAGGNAPKRTRKRKRGKAY